MMKRYLLLVLLLCTTGAFAQVAPAPSLMNFQGRLAKPDGTPLVNGNYNVTFSLWNVASGGSIMTNQLWTETSVVTVRSGTFALLLGKTTAFPASLFNNNLWLEIKVGTDAALTPRQQLVSVAYAMKANGVPDGSIGTAQIANGSITSAKFAAGVGGSGWGLTGNAATDPLVNFLGTTDAKPLLFKVNNQRVFRFEDVIDAANNIRSVNVIGGIAANAITNNAYGVVIAGGGQFFTNGQASQPNTVSGNYGVIGGGSNNKVTNFFGQVGGGFNNAANGDFAVVGGGRNQQNDGGDAFIGGGNGNYTDVANRGQFVGGGLGNIGQGDNAVIGGGESNNTSGNDSVIGGGKSNYAGGNFSIVGSGSGNEVSFGTIASAIVGGDTNKILGSYAAIGGGGNNSANANYSAIPGGKLNIASGLYSLAAGYGAHALNTGSFVWSDNSNAFASTNSLRDNTFTVRAAGGTLINGGFAVTGASSPYPTATAPGVFIEAGGTTYGAMYAFNYANFTPLNLVLNTPGGNVGIGTTTPAYRLDVSGSARVSVAGGTAMSAYSPNASAVYGLSVSGDGVQGSSTSAWGVRGFSNNSLGVFGATGSSSGVGVYGRGSGNGYAVYADGNAGGLSQWFNISDARYKTNIVTLGNALDDVLKLRGVSYEWDKMKWPDKNFAEGKQIGFIAQEVENLFPAFVHTDDKGYKSVAYANLVPVLVEAMKTLNGKVEATQTENAELKRHNADMEKRSAELEKQIAALAAAVKQLQDARK